MIQASPYSRSYETDSYDDYLQTIHFYNEKQMKLAITKALTYPENYDDYDSTFLDNNFLKLVARFLGNGGNPNLTFTEIEIGFEQFHHTTFFHVVYIYWKICATDNPSTDKIFENLIDRLLRDKRVDVRAKFTEKSFPGSDHFCVLDEKYYDQDEAEGYCLERITIAHYALVKEDLSTLEKVLEIAPDLLETPCCLTRGKSLLNDSYVLKIADLTRPNLDKVRADYEHWDTNRKGVECFSIGDRLRNNRSYKINENERKFNDRYYTLLDLNNKRITGELADNIAGELAVVVKINLDTSEKILVPVTRIARVTLMHLAARSGNDLACGFLRGRKVNCYTFDSEGLSPFHYLQDSLSKGIVRRTGVTQQLCKALEPIVRLNTSYLPETCRVLHREGYEIICDTRTKVASYVYERLIKDSLRENAKREGHSFKVDRDVPFQNRIKHADITKSGWDAGHLRAAANAVSSEKAMADTFLFTNMCPQDRSLNRGYWKGLENHIRSRVNDYDVVEIFTGPLFLPQQGLNKEMRVSYEVIGSGKVAVPTHFFKVLYLYKHPTTTHEAYILPNAPIPANTPLTTFLKTVDEVQQLSGILFSQSHFAT